MKETWTDNEEYTVHGKSPEQMTPLEMMLKDEEVQFEQFTGEKEKIADLYLALTDRSLTEIVNNDA